MRTKKKKKKKARQAGRSHGIQKQRKTAFFMVKAWRPYIKILCAY
jgi:hypothetical protein